MHRGHDFAGFEFFKGQGSGLVGGVPSIESLFIDLSHLGIVRRGKGADAEIFLLFVRRRLLGVLAHIQHYYWAMPSFATLYTSRSPYANMPGLIAAFQQVGDELCNGGTLRALQRNMRKKLVPLELFNHCLDAIVTAHAQVIALRYVMGEHHPRALA